MSRRTDRSVFRGGAAALPLLALMAGAALAAPIRFHTATSYPLATDPVIFSVGGDFDGDGDVDFAAERLAGGLWWWSNAAGALSGPFAITTPHPIFGGLAAGDLNGDGRADLVACTPEAAGGAIAILLGTGAGFAPASLVPTDSAEVVSATLGDLDGDGDLDLVAVNRVTRKLHRLFNDGAANFSGLASVRLAGELSRAWISDLNGDNRVDILTGNWPQFALRPAPGPSPWESYESWTLPGTGGGAFGAPVAAGLRAGTALGSFSAPGAKDMLVHDASRIGIAAGQGNGTFAPPVFTPGTWLSTTEAFAEPIDLDGDGRDEIVYSAGGGHSPAFWGVLRVQSALALSRAEVHASYMGRTAVVADMNGDGRKDAVMSQLLVATNHDGDLGGSHLLTRRQTTAGFFEELQDLDVADLNGDRRPDIIATAKIGTGSIFLGRDDRTFETGYPFQGNTYIRSSIPVDLDGDRDLDLLQLYQDSGFTCRAYAWFNDGTGHQASTTSVSFDSQHMFGLTAADFDGDGDVDGISSDISTNQRRLLTNDGAGNFTVSVTALPMGTYGPVDGDLLPARYSSTATEIQIEHATAPEVLAPPVVTPAGGTIAAARFADVNGDGRIDAVLLMADGPVRTFLGGAGGAWTGPVDSPTPPVPAGYTATFANIGNLDPDGLPDLLFFGSGSTAAISVLRNLGGGAFGERGDSFTNQSFGTVIADFDGDGAGDLLGIDPFTGNFTRAVNILFGIPNLNPTPVLVSLVSAVAAHDHARLTWQFPADVPATASIERRVGGGGWSEIARVAPAGDRIVYEDRAVEPGARYDWRLAWTEAGTTRRSDVVSLAIPARASFAIAGVAPNPADGERIRVMLSVDRVAPVEVRLLDLAGRVVARRRIEAPAVGTRAVDLDGLAGLRAGLYFVRAEQEGRRVSKTVARLK